MVVKSKSKTKPLVLFSDLHFKTETFEVCCKVLDEIAAHCVKTKSNLAFGGDWFDKRNELPVLLYYALAKRIETWKFETIILPGNHDQFNIEGHNALEILGAFPNVRVMSDPEWNEYGLWVPYRYKHEDLQAAFKLKKPKDAPAVAFMHHGLNGAMMNSFKMNTEGLTVDDIPKKFKRIYLGHYHAFQDMGRAVYVGSPYQTNWSEIGQPKGFLEINGADFKFKEWNIGPTHNRIEWSGKGKPKLPKGFREGYDYAKVVLKMNQDDAAKNKVHKKLVDAGLADAVVDFQAKKKESSRGELDQTKPRKEQIESFIAQVEMPEGIDKTLALETLSDLIGGL